MLFQGPDDMDSDTFVAHDDVAEPQYQGSSRIADFYLSLFSRSNFHPPTIEEMVPRPSM